MIGDWQECSKCPKGKHTRVVKCVRPTGEGEGETVVVSDSECAGPKPRQKEPCRCQVSLTTTDRSSTGHGLISKANISRRMCTAPPSPSNNTLVRN